MGGSERLSVHQEAWNVWSEGQYAGEQFRAIYTAGVERAIYVDCGKAKVQTALWSTGTGGNPGAKPPPFPPSGPITGGYDDVKTDVWWSQ